MTTSSHVGCTGLLLAVAVKSDSIGGFRVCVLRTPGGQLQLVPIRDLRLVHSFDLQMPRPGDWISVLPGVPAPRLTVVPGRWPSRAVAAVGRLRYRSRVRDLLHKT